MERIFTKNVGKNKRGTVRRYPRLTWDAISKSMGIPLHKFSIPVGRAGELVGKR